MERIARREGIYIQHAENDGEFRIPGTNFKADGYCAETNTIYEYYGARYHGCPKTYRPNQEINVFGTIHTAKSLYKKTIKREKVLLDLGYNLVVKWEKAKSRKHLW